MASSAAHSLIEGIRRKEIQLAMAKAAELRAIHAALIQGNDNSPGITSHLADSSLLSRFSTHFSSAAEDYPIFALPAYEGEPLPSGNHRNLADNCSGCSRSESRRDEIDLSGSIKVSPLNNDQVAYPGDEPFSYRSLCLRQSPIIKTAPSADVFKSTSMRSAAEELKIMSFNTTKASRENDAVHKNLQCINSKAPSVEIHIPSVNSQPKSKGASFSWWFHKTKKKTKLEMPLNTATESENMPQPLKDWELFSLVVLKRELFEANEQKDMALAEVSEMRFSLGELQQKLATVESYCEELKKSLKNAFREQERLVLNTSKRTKLINSNLSCGENSLPVSHDAMVEGFLQVVSEARLSVKHFCKTLIDSIDRCERSLPQKLSTFLPLNPNEKCSKLARYHLESLTNQSFHQDFENCAFQNNGTSNFLDPHHNRAENFASFVALRNLSWNEALKEGTEHYGDDFRSFCNQKMSSIVSMLDWSKPFPEILLHSFFVACKCIWLLHLLAFSFNPPLTILRVAENITFNPLYMEDVLEDRQQRAHFSAQVKVMVMPGFFVHDKVLKSRVLCRYD